MVECSYRSVREAIAAELTRMDKDHMHFIRLLRSKATIQEVSPEMVRSDSFLDFKEDEEDREGQH